MKEQVTLAIGEILAFIMLFMIGITPAMIAVGVLIFADTFAGVWASVKKGGWESFTSRKAGRIITKIIFYPLAIIIAKVAEEYLSPGIGWIYITTSIVAVVEIKSIFENIGSILGFKLWDRVKRAVWKDREIDEDPYNKKDNGQQSKGG